MRLVCLEWRLSRGWYLDWDGTAESLGGQPKFFAVYGKPAAWPARLRVKGKRVAALPSV